MTKTIDFSKTVYELSAQYPEVVEIFAEIGFRDILKPGMLKTAGRFMTVEKGSQAKKIDIELIKQAFINRGFEIK